LSGRSTQLTAFGFSNSTSLLCSGIIEGKTFPIFMAKLTQQELETFLWGAANIPEGKTALSGRQDLDAHPLIG
jgi:hypothetical protein